MEQSRPTSVESLLVDEGWLGAEAVDVLVRVQPLTGMRLPLLAVRSGLVDELELAHALALQHRLPTVPTDRLRSTPESRALLSRRLALDAVCLPLIAQPDRCVAAIADPYDTIALDAVRSATARPTLFVVAGAASLFEAILRDYDGHDPVLLLLDGGLAKATRHGYHLLDGERHDEDETRRRRAA